MTAKVRLVDTDVHCVSRGDKNGGHSVADQCLTDGGGGVEGRAGSVEGGVVGVVHEGDDWGVSRLEDDLACCTRCTRCIDLEGASAGSPGGMEQRK